MVSIVSESYRQTCTALANDIADYVRSSCQYSSVPPHLKRLLVADALCSSINTLAASIYEEQHGEPLTSLWNGDDSDDQAYLAKIIGDFLGEFVGQDDKAKYPRMIAVLTDALVTIISQLATGRK